MTYLIALATALWLGILTSISPCPLASNIAAVAYLSRRVEHLKVVLFSGIAYTLGRMVAYMLLGVLVIYSLLSIPTVALFLQSYMNMLLGPILLIVGLLLLGVIPVNFPSFAISSQRQEQIAKTGIRGSFVLGIIFALSFCPISAALFFGSLIPLSMNNPAGVLFPLFYGIGTALPVLFFAVGIAFGMEMINTWFHLFKRIEFYTRKITAVIFIGVGLYYIWLYIISRFIAS